MLLSGKVELAYNDIETEITKCTFLSLLKN